MLIARILGFIAVISIGGSFVVYLVTKDRRYLRLAGQIFRYGVLLAAAFMAFYVLERLILVA